MITSVEVLTKQQWIDKHKDTWYRHAGPIEAFYDSFAEGGNTVVEITTEDGGYVYSIARLERALHL